MLRKLLMADRSYRRFDEGHRIDKETLIQLVELTRYCASGRNLQPLKYFVANENDMCDKIFPLLKWAGYLPEWDGPVKGERPTAYLIQCLDTNITKSYLSDDGLQQQAITLGAVAEGLGCCIIKSFNVIKLKEILGLPDNYEPIYVIAIGKPIEKVVIDDMSNQDSSDIKYYRTPDGIHHVPKRSLDDLVITVSGQ
ncbi:MAG: nitroreductase family protein [Muribaculaceae bacterium]|nr:nitroreductase family protein [Muribaculaceae bacterium]